MIQDILDILGISGDYDFVVVWIALLVISLFIYEAFSFLFVIFQRVGGTK